MRKTFLAVLSGLMATSAQAHSVSSTVTFVSDYLFNGYSQTRSHPTMQLSLDYSHDQYYAGLWTSDVDFDTGVEGQTVDTEVDAYFGYNLPIGKDFSLEVGAAQYMYPGLDNSLEADYAEVYIGLTAWQNSLVKAWYADDYYGDTGNAWVLRLQQLWPVNDTLTLKAQANIIGHEDSPNYWLGVQDGYHHYQVGAIQKWRDINVEVAYSDTTLDSKDDPSEVADSTLWLSISRTFSY